MARRTLLACVVVALVPALARADVAPSPPPPLEIRAAPLVHTARSGGPTEATWVLRNTGTTPLHVRVTRVVGVTDSMRLPLTIASASPGREIDVAPGASVDLRVAFSGFDGPAARAHEWTVEITVDVSGAGDRFARTAMGTTTVRRIPLPG